MPLRPYKEVRAAVAALAAPHVPVRVRLGDARGLVAAADVVAGFDVPPFANSAMDGYAVRAADLAELAAGRCDSVTLPVVCVAAAGRPSPRPVAAGEAGRILTGAVMIDGADTVVPVEATDAGEVTVTIHAASAPGAHVRRAGEDVAAGTVVIGAGEVLTAPRLGVLANCGVAEVAVVPRPRVAVVSTGDELVPPGEPLAPGQIYDSNRVVLAATLADRFGIEATSRHLPDDAAAVAAALDELGASHEVVLSTGGVSMGGEFDVVKAGLASHDVAFVQIAIKPAKPFAYGRLGAAVFCGLPGNPVSSLVSFELFVVPLLRRLLGRTPEVPSMVQRPAGATFALPRDAKTHFVRVVTGDDGAVRPAAGQGSHQLAALAAADALAVLEPAGSPGAVAAIAPGEPVTLIPLPTTKDEIW